MSTAKHVQEQEVLSVLLVKMDIHYQVQPARQVTLEDHTGSEEKDQAEVVPLLMETQIGVALWTLILVLDNLQVTSTFDKQSAL